MSKVSLTGVNANAQFYAQVSAVLDQIKRVRCECLAAQPFTPGGLKLNGEAERNLAALDAAAGHLERLLAQVRGHGTDLNANMRHLSGWRMAAKPSAGGGE